MLCYNDNITENGEIERTYKNKCSIDIIQTEKNCRYKTKRYYDFENKTIFSEKSYCALSDKKCFHVGQLIECENYKAFLEEEKQIELKKQRQLDISHFLNQIDDGAGDNICIRKGFKFHRINGIWEY